MAIVKGTITAKVQTDSYILVDFRPDGAPQNAGYRRMHVVNHRDPKVRQLLDVGSVLGHPNIPNITIDDSDALTHGKIKILP